MEAENGRKQEVGKPQLRLAIEEVGGEQRIQLVEVCQKQI